MLFMNSMKLVIPLHSISWKKTPNDAVTQQRQSQFAPKMKANVVLCLLSSLVWIDRYNECNGMTCFMEFMIQAIYLTSQAYPVKNLSSQLTHEKLTLKLTKSSFWGHTAHSELTRWTQMSSPTYDHAVVAVSSLWELQTHGKLTAIS